MRSTRKPCKRVHFSDVCSAIVAGLLWLWIWVLPALLTWTYMDEKMQDEINAVQERAERLIRSTPSCYESSTITIPAESSEVINPDGKGVITFDFMRDDE